jgi:Cupin domain/Carboxypeptidase regulatory-like domain
MRAVLVAMMIVMVQAGPYAQGRGRAGSRPAAPRETTVRVLVRTTDGSSIDGVRVSLSGDASAEFTTAGAGLVILPNLTDGTYRVRCEKEGLVTVEREFAVKAGAPASIELVMNSQPPAPPPPQPPPPAAEPMPAGPPVSMVIADFVDRNFIGREPIKESILACKPLETVRLLQMREAIAAHTHAEGDELIYVIAGEGNVRLGDEVVALKPSSLVVVPSGLSHQLERRGKNPLIVMSTLTGEPCSETTTSK